MFIFTLFCGIHGIHCMESFEKEFGSVVGNFVLRMSDLGGAVVCVPQKQGAVKEN